jgi:hypothetical protein
MIIEAKDTLNASKKHFTKPAFAYALLKLIESEPSCVLDPAVGHGALLRAAVSRWPNTKLIGFDLSKDAVETAKVNLPLARLSCVDALRTPWTIKGKAANSPLVACNPPFLGESLAPITTRVDIRFFNRCIKALHNSGLLLFVFPQSIASSPSFRETRTEWLSHSTLTAAIELPQNAFKNTEASAVAVIFKPGKPTGNSLVKFLVIGRNAQIVQQTKDRVDGSSRFDPKYYVLRNWLPKIASALVPLGEIAQDVRRGIFVREILTRSKQGHSYIHSTNLRHGWIADRDKALVGPDVQTNVNGGSILLSRVGKKLWEKFALYTGSHSSTASDCLYIVKTENLLTSGYLVAMLTTRFMQLSIRRTTRGTTVPILNKKELLDLPIPWLPLEERCAIGTAWLRSKSRVQRGAITAILENRLSCNH